jgi:hypothetical protein
MSLFLEHIANDMLEVPLLDAAEVVSWFGKKKETEFIQLDPNIKR